MKCVKLGIFDGETLKQLSIITENKLVFSYDER